MALSGDAASALERLTAAYTVRTRVADPAGPLRRAATDVTPNGLSDSYGYAPNTNDNRRRGARYGATFKPNASHFYGNPVPATARVSATVAPRGGIQQRAPRRTVSAKSRNYFPGTGDLSPEEWRLWTRERANMARDTGDLAVPGTSYPCGLTAKGNPAPAPGACLATLDQYAEISR